MWHKEDNFVVKIGSNYYKNTPNIIVYKGDNLFTIKRAESTDLLGIDFDIHDQKENKIAVVKQGRIYSGDKDSYETTINTDEYILKDKKTGRIICHIKKRTMTNRTELDVNVSLYTKDGFLINATPEKTNIGSSIISGNTFDNSGAAIVIQ
jgi:hypothetical protein